METNFKTLNIDEIETDEDFNSRGQFNKSQVADLARDIEENTPRMPDTQGLIQPVTVRRFDQPKIKNGKTYYYGLIAGFRRTFAFQVLNRKTIPAIIREHVSDVDASFWNLSENLQRKDLNILQEAGAIEKLRALDITMDVIAKKLNKSITWVKIRCDLLKLPPEIQQEAAAGTLNQHHIKNVARLKKPEQQFQAVKLIKDAIEKGTRASDIVVKKTKVTANQKKVRSRPEIFELIEHLGNKIDYGLHTRVLSWAAGEITNNEVENSIVEFAKEKGINYTRRNFAVENLENEKALEESLQEA